MAETSGRDLPFLIVGAGIGGLTAALSLTRAGFPVHVIEQASELKEIGAGIQLGPNVFRMLDILGIMDAVVKGVVARISRKTSFGFDTHSMHWRRR